VNKAEKIDQLTPYQLEFPKEALPEIFVKDALTSDERMWVPQSENVWFRPLCLNRSQGYWVTLLKVKKAGVLSRHRHPQGVHGFVIKGAGNTLNMIGWQRKVLTFTNLQAKRTH